MKNFFTFLEMAFAIFVFHILISFASSGGDLINPFTFPLMNLLIHWLKQSGEPNWDISVGLLMYPAMAMNSWMWSLGLAWLLSSLNKFVLSRRKKA